MTSQLPDQVDLAKLSAQAARLSGEVPVTALSRLVRIFQDVQPVSAELVFSLDEQGRPTIHGELSTEVTANCQRCLHPVVVNVRGEFDFGADDLGAGDAEPRTELPRLFSLRTLVEDEVLLACPMIPLHAAGRCEPPAAGNPGGAPENPFDVLRAFRQNDG